MDVWLAICSVIMGSTVAIVVYDIGTRGSVISTLRKQKTELAKTIESVQTVHNSLSNKVLELEEKLAALDFKVNTGPKPSNRPHGNRR